MNDLRSVAFPRHPNHTSLNPSDEEIFRWLSETSGYAPGTMAAMGIEFYVERETQIFAAARRTTRENGQTDVDWVRVIVPCVVEYGVRSTSAQPSEVRVRGKRLVYISDPSCQTYSNDSCGWAHKCRRGNTWE